MHRGVIAFLVSGLMLAVSTAHAQEHGRVGLSMGYPETVDLLWHATERIVIRPGVSWRHGTFSGVGLTFSNGFGTTSSTSSNETTEIGVEVSALMGIRSWDNVQAYVAPGYAYRRITGTDVTTTVTGSARTVETETQGTRGHDHVVSGTFGIRYVPHRRFGVFGESGIEYSNSSSAFPGLSFVSDTTTKLESWGTVTRVGVIFYF